MFALNITNKHEKRDRMRKFESQVQLKKYEVLREVSKMSFEGSLDEEYNKIPEIIDKGPEATTRCCIYKERAVTKDRVSLAMGELNSEENVIQVIDSACDACPIDRYVVTEACRGCLAHRCQDVCPVGAIKIVAHRAYIDQNKCVECGKCKQACPYNAISDVMRPCRRACPVGAISLDGNKKAVIDDSKCIQCGACVYQCPFGAIMDSSYIVDIINLLKESKKGTRVYATIAPAISSQFTYASIEQVVNGIKKLGFHDVVEAALGADFVVEHEAKEWLERIEAGDSFMTSSCCPAFVKHIENAYPQLMSSVSHTISPMKAIARLIKNVDKDAKVVFIGPCTAKKREWKEQKEDDVDYVMTFEELAAMLDAKGIELDKCEESPLNNASFYGRIFARSGGLEEAVNHILEEHYPDKKDSLTAMHCDGMEECEKALKLAKFGRLKANFIEGMACRGGCIGGAASLSHGPKDRLEVDRYGKKALEPDVDHSLRIFNKEEIKLE